MFRKAEYICVCCKIKIKVEKIEYDGDTHPKITCPWCGRLECLINRNANAVNTEYL